MSGPAVVCPGLPEPLLVFHSYRVGGRILVWSDPPSRWEGSVPVSQPFSNLVRPGSNSPQITLPLQQDGWALEESFQQAAVRAGSQGQRARKEAPGRDPGH